MNIERKLTTAVICSPLLFCGLQALAQSKPLPQLVGQDLTAEYGVSSASVLDGTQDFDFEFDPSVPSVYVPILPCRIVDTRETGDRFGMATIDPLDMTGVRGYWGWAGSDCADGGGTCYATFGGSATPCGIPSEATAVHMNFTITNPRGTGFLRAWPNNSDEPEASLLSWGRGASTAVTATVSICADYTESTDYDFEIPGGTVTLADCPDSHDTHTGIVDFWVKIYGAKKEHLVIDAFGYYAPLAIQP